MKTTINYKTNEELWSIEDTATAYGYEKKEDCYWVQIFRDASGNEIITTRDN